jgi:hypothetical protein
VTVRFVGGEFVAAEVRAFVTEQFPLCRMVVLGSVHKSATGERTNRTLRSIVTKVRTPPSPLAAGPMRHAVITKATEIHNANPSSVLNGLTPLEAEVPDNLWHVIRAREDRRLTEAVRYSVQYDSVKKFAVGDFVYRRLRQRRGYLRTIPNVGEPVAVGVGGRLKEANRDYNLSRTVYRVIAIRKTTPLESYILQAVGGDRTFPGSYTGTELVRSADIDNPDSDTDVDDG